MAKITSTTVQPGQITELQEKAIAKLPTGQPIQEEGTELSSFADLVADREPVAAPIPDEGLIPQEEAVAEDLERGRVPTLTERSQQTAIPSRWRQQEAPPVISDDGGINQRARNMANKFSTNSSWTGGLGISPAADKEAGGLSSVLSKTGAIVNQSKVEKPDGTGVGFQTDIDPLFLQVGSVVTENIITRLAEGQTPTVDFQAEKVDREEAAPKGEVGKAQSNIELGNQVNREYQRLKNANEGRPTDDYQDLDPNDASVLGDAFKEMYASANPNYLKRAESEFGTYVAFQLTAEGDAALNSPEAKLKRAILFPGVNVRPAKTPQKGQLQSEVGRTATKRQTGHVKGTPAGTQVIDEAKRNLSTVANVVDNQRLKIAYATVIPALMGDPLWRDIHNIGSKQEAKFAAEAKKAQREGIEYDPVVTMQGLENNLAQALRALAMERKGANYLTYYTQNFNGRIAPQQSYFDPTTSKLVRFATRNAIPAKAVPHKRVDKNLRQMYAMMLVDGADALLPNEREFALQSATPQLEKWGNELIVALDNAITNEQADAISQAIEEGRPLNELENLPVLQVSEDLQQAINKKGEDGPHYIDGLIDFAKYSKARKAGVPHNSFFNAYMDGKTNGIASNGIQMGSREIAFKTGVLRTGNRTLLDEGIDVRDALMNNLTEELDTTGIQTTDPNMYTVARAVYNYRQLAKDTTMTFGYGKEMESFEEDISDTVDLLIEIDPDVAAAMEALTQDKDRDGVVNDLWSAYTNHLGGALSAEALESRPLMRAAATYFALMDRPFTMTTATDFELNLGGELTTGEHGEGYTETAYTIHEDGKKRKVTAQRYATRPTALAAKGDDKPGSRAYGGSLPGPVQSIDAATVALTASGKSWKKLKENSHGHPYLHTIYDAFKVDAMGYDVVLDEVNNNWLDASMKWSYLESTMDSLQENIKEYRKELNEYPNSLPIDTDFDGEYGMFMYLTTQTESDKGTMGPWSLAKMLAKIRDKGNLDNDAYFKENIDIAYKIMNQMKQQGHNPEKPTIGDLKNFFGLFSNAVALQPRLSKMINHTNRKKKELQQEIKRGGVPVYQYYAH